jgi:acetyl esterase/lipase
LLQTLFYKLYLFSFYSTIFNAFFLISFMKYKIPVILFLLTLIFQSMHSQQVLPLYTDSIPNSKPGVNEETTEYRDGLTLIWKVAKPEITVFLPPQSKANGTAVIICPGGGYQYITANMEGTDVAAKFNEMGVAAIVLKYRIPNDAWMLNKEIGPLQDAQQAIKTVREHAMQWNINPNKIGIMGFSAGGHLASTAGTHFNKVLIPNANNTSLRPDFMILIYPVISFHPAICHTGSKEQLVGKNAGIEKIKEYSNELQVTGQTPPAFLVHASDDDAVSPMNSIAFYDSLISKKIPSEIHIYQSGGHGFGMSMKNNREQWMERCESWLKFNGWLQKQ